MGEECACAANHFEQLQGAWRPRPIDSAGRASAARRPGPILPVDDFGWFTAPIANINSRLAFSAAARDGSLALMGTRGSQPTTEILRLN
jgi:hypothetical protein